MIRIDIDDVNQVRQRFELHYQATKIRIVALQVRNDQLIRRLQLLREEGTRLKKRLYDKYQAIESAKDESAYNPGISPKAAVVDNSFVYAGSLPSQHIRTLLSPLMRTERPYLLDLLPTPSDVR